MPITKTVLYKGMTEEEVHDKIFEEEKYNATEADWWAVRQIVAFEAGGAGPGARRGPRPGQTSLGFFVVYERGQELT